ncbi:hypothetical protein, partial [Niabella hirudinis]|uniref:hypothetical protein n=1 Tax=Niabella hirudinis TaxID=1285929 RepID=UPI003EB6A9D1
RSQGLCTLDPLGHTRFISISIRYSVVVNLPFIPKRSNLLMAGRRPPIRPGQLPGARNIQFLPDYSAILTCTAIVFVFL